MATEKRKPAPTVTKFLDQLKLRMNELGMTQADLARKMGYSEALVSRFLRGDSNLSSPTMEKLASAVGSEVTIQLLAPTEPETEASVKPAPAPAEPVKRREALKARAHALAEEGGPELVVEIARMAPKDRNPVGRPPGAIWDYSAHLLQMARLLVSGEARGVTEASELAAQWAKNIPGLKVVSPRTLRRYFRKDEDRYRAQAAFVLAKERKDATAEGDAPAKPARRVWKRASGGGGTGAGHAALGRPLSSYGWVNLELNRLQDELRFSPDVMEALREPYMLEEIRSLAAGRPELTDLTAVAGLDRDLTRAMETIPKEVLSVAEEAAKLSSTAVLAAQPFERILEDSAVHQIARHLQGASEAMDRISAFRDQVWLTKPPHKLFE